MTPSDGKKSKRSQSKDQASPENSMGSRHQKKKKKLVRSNAENSIEQVQSNDESEDEVEVKVDAKDTAKLPDGTPEWGIKMLEIIQSEFRQFTDHIGTVEIQSNNNTAELKTVQKKLEKVKERNKFLQDENVLLKERLLELEFKQRQCNLIFEGIVDGPNEPDISCINKLRNALHSLNSQSFDASTIVIDKCYRIDGPYKQSTTR